MFIVERPRSQISRLNPFLVFSSLYSTIQIRVEKERMTGPKGFEQSISALLHPTIPGDQSLKSPTLFLPSGCAFLLAQRPLLSSRILELCCPLYRFQVDAACGCFTFPGAVTETPYRCFYCASRRTSPCTLPGSTRKMSV